MLKSVNQIAARTESSHGEEETEPVQASPRQVTSEQMRGGRGQEVSRQDGSRQETPEQHGGHTGSGGD